MEIRPCSIRRILQRDMQRGAALKTAVRIDPRYFRPAEVDQLCGDPSKAKEKLGWIPEVKFAELVKLMVEGDLRLLDDPNYEIGF